MSLIVRHLLVGRRSLLHALAWPQPGGGFLNSSSNSTNASISADREWAKTALEFFKGIIPPAEPWDLDAEDGDGNPKKILVPTVVSAIILDALAKTAEGKAVALILLDEEVTTQQAANILKVSRPFVVSLVKNGELPSRQVGNRNRLPLKDVLDYKAANAAKRRSQP